MPLISVWIRRVRICDDGDFNTFCSAETIRVRFREKNVLISSDVQNPIKPPLQHFAPCHGLRVACVCACRDSFTYTLYVLYYVLLVTSAPSDFCK